MVAVAGTVEAVDIVDPVLWQGIQNSVSSALEMCALSTRCVGLSSIPVQDSGHVTGLIGVHGAVSGFVMVNLAERFALQAVGGLLQDKFPALSAQVVDGVGELTNLIAGGIKRQLAGTPWAFGQITVPSVIIGTGYRIAYARGLQYVCATFEHEDPEALHLADRLLHVSLSLLRL